MKVMKSISRILIITSLAFLLGFPTTISFAQAQQCSDKIDNDSDGKIDTSGASMGNPRLGGFKVYPPDPECQVAGAMCENGLKTSTCAQANDPGVTNPQNPNDPGITNSGSNTNQATEFPLQVKLKNPLKVNTIQDAIKLFMDAVVKIAIPFIVVFFIWSGINFILAQGNAEKLKKAKNMFWYTVIGTLLILGAWAITDAIVGTINSIAS